MVLLASRAGDDWQARLTSFIMIYSLAGLRDEAMNQALGQAFKSAMAPGGPGVSRIRRDPHEPGPDCWLHAECCISRA
jgi:hypothetical protein